MRRVVVAAAASLLALAGSVPARAAPDRAFSVSAAAFPVEPAPGTNQTSLGIRPAATRASLSNPPPTAYGRAAAYDLGTIELYTGPPPPDSVAECDTGSDNVPDDAAAAPADMQLTARCTTAPSVDVRAVGRSFESGGLAVTDLASHVTADGSGDEVRATASVTSQAITLGPLVVETVATRASAGANGKAGGATATGRVTTSGATVNGTPVVIDADGITVDRTRVPLELVNAATAAVRDALGQGGYSDVRVVQPATETSDDGMHAAVRGGGLMLFFTNNDPAENYFLRITFGGVDLAVDLGSTFDTSGGGGGAAPAPGGIGSSGDDDEVIGSLGVVGGGSGNTSALGQPGSAAAGVDADPVLTAGRRAYDLPEPWRGWPVLVAVAVAAIVAGVAGRRRLVGWWNVNADRYLRG